MLVLAMFMIVLARSQEPVNETARVGASWAATPFVEPPQAFIDEGGEGRATLTCDIEVNGRVKTCVLDEENPVGLGLGDAALAARPSFRLNPAMSGGEPVEDRITFTVVFKAAPPELRTPEATLIPAETQRAFSLIDMFGFQAGVCEQFLEPSERDHLEDGVAQYKTDQRRLPVFDQILFGAYGRGREDGASNEKSEAYCEAALASARARMEAASDMISAVEATFPSAGRRQGRQL